MVLKVRHAEEVAEANQEVGPALPLDEGSLWVGEE